MSDQYCTCPQELKWIDIIDGKQVHNKCGKEINNPSELILEIEE